MTLFPQVDKGIGFMEYLGLVSEEASISAKEGKPLPKDDRDWKMLGDKAVAKLQIKQSKVLGSLI